MNFKFLPFVSVIVTTKNEEKNIENCLKAIQRQTYPQEKIEIIVVDNNSIDQTKAIAKRYTKKVYCYFKPNERKTIKNFRGAQLNFGVRKSKGEIIFFPDADMTFDEELISEAVGIIREKKISALYVPEMVIGKGLFGKIRNFERSFYNGTCLDAPRILKKGLFLRIGGFDEKNISFGFDDWDFTKTLKKLIDRKRIGMTINKIYHHEEELTFRRYLNKKRKYATTAEVYLQKWGKDDPEIQRQFGFYYRYFGVFIENGKWKKLLKHPFLTTGMYFLRIMVGLNFLRRLKFTFSCVKTKP